MKVWSKPQIGYREYHRYKDLIGRLVNVFSRMELIVPLIVVSLVLVMASRVPLDSDMWWHLRAGEATWLNKFPLITDQFTFILQGERWINHSWLSQVILYLVYKSGGYPAIALFVALLAAASMGFVYLQMDGSPLTRAFIIVIGVPVAATVWAPRPQTVSLVLFSALSYLLYLYKWRKKNLLWTCPLLFILWSNLHGGYALGLILMGVYLVGEIINLFLDRPGDGALSGKELAQILIWFSISALVVVINPNGFSMWVIPFRTIGVNILQEKILEWQSPDFHDIYQQPFLWLLFATLGAAGISRRQLDGTELAGVVLFAYFGFLARRNFGPFAVFTLPVFSRHLTAIPLSVPSNVIGWFERLNPIRAANSRIRVTKPVNLVINIIILILLLIGAGLKLEYVSSNQMISRYERELFPVQATEWIEANRPPGPLFNSYNWGGYLIWKLREYPVFIDGRTDLFGDHYLDIYLQISEGTEAWENLLDDYHINLVLIERDTELGKALKSSHNWRLVYQDELAEVYVRAVPSDVS